MEKESKIEYQSEQVINRIVFELEEAQKDCKEENEDFNSSDYQSRIYRGRIFHDGNFQFIIELMFTEEDNKKAQLGGITVKKTIAGNYQNQILPELWEKAILKIQK